jgi:hypothetical protein
MKRKLALPISSSASSSSSNSKSKNRSQLSIQRILKSSSSLFESSEERPDDISCQICGVNIKHFNFEQRNQHVNDCIDRKSPAAHSNHRRSKIEDDDKDDFMEPTSPLLKKFSKKKIKVSDENAVIPNSISLGSAGSAPSSSSQGTGSENNLDSQISRCRSRLIEIEGQIAEHYYHRTQVNKEIKKLLKKQSLESQHFHSDQVTSHSLDRISSLPIEELMTAAFGSKSESFEQKNVAEGQQQQEEEKQQSPCPLQTPVIDSMKHPLWSLSRQLSSFENIISNSETSPPSQLLSVSHSHNSHSQEPSLFSQLESAAQEVCDEKQLGPLAPLENKDLDIPTVRRHFEDLLTIVSSRKASEGGSPDTVWAKIQENLKSSIELLESQISLQPVQANHPTPLLELESEQVEPLTPVRPETSFSQSLQLSQSVVIVSDSDDLPSQPKPHSPPPRSYESLQLSIEDSPISWRQSQHAVDVDHFDLTSPSSAIPLSPSPTPPPLNQRTEIAEIPPFPLITPPPSTATTANLDILSSNELPSLSEYSLDQLKSICRSYGLKQSENSSLMTKALLSLWNRHHHRSDQISHSQQNSHSLSSEPCHDSREVLSEWKKRIKDYLCSQEDLYTKVLSFQSVDLEDLKQRLKDNGVVLSKSLLRDLLDEEGVFVTSSSN